MCTSNSRFETATSLSRFTTTVVPSSSTALYDVPTLPLPSTSADARSRSSKSKLYPPPFPTKTSRFRSAAATADAVPLPLTPPLRSSFDDDVIPVSPAAVAAAVPFGALSLAVCRLHRKAKQTKSSSRINSSTTPAATAIAIFAAFDSFFFDDPFTGFAAGDGAGEGKNGLQGFRGPPHRSRFPAKDEAGKRARHAEGGEVAEGAGWDGANEANAGEPEAHHGGAVGVAGDANPVAGGGVDIPPKALLVRGSVDEGQQRRPVLRWLRPKQAQRRELPGVPDDNDEKDENQQSNRKRHRG
ncbi:hypothetical protein B296_00030300 [Ensete ventricosum]|uniref:Uncharacterized protein n=1 Tax=Ensete ventricosum TaxID=4639 RepID=A0A426YDK1_ENSVE|nr:hypothetical protein B296_00030300 [Ensete ventricosum]